MDMRLDAKSAVRFKCSECNVALAALRNCDGTGKPAKNFVNETIHEQCPRYIYMSDQEARFLVELYLECRESKTLPAPGSLMHQTCFTVELFEFLDQIIDRHRAKMQKEQAEAIRKAQKGGKK